MLSAALAVPSSCLVSPSSFVSSPSQSSPLPLPSNILATAPPPGGKKRHPLKGLLAGGLVGAIEISITYPTEYVKTQMQLYESAGALGPVQCAKLTIKQHGVLGLYKGLSSLLYFSVPKVGTRFYAYEQLKSLLADKDGKLTTSSQLLAGMGAGTAEAVLVVTPMETIKVRLIHDQLSAKPKYRGFVHGVTSIFKEHGFNGVYKGLGPTIAKQGSNQAIRFFVYDKVKGFLESFHPGKAANPLETALSGVVAGAASVIGNTPIDVIKTRMQGLHASKYKGSFDCARQILKHEGVKGFYKGTMARMGRVCADAAIVFTLYEQVMNLLDKVWKTE
eukprot:GILI01003685.1.p1 GENE.GILI01003685.1~~GILI01003685.1.p1  ORF type:complete len:333 (+),score=91.82 GILI01003685.1:244-1242(+)